MLNSLDINYRANLAHVCEGIIERISAGAFRGRETLRGCMWAVEFMASLDHEHMTDAECSHAIRCMTFRGAKRPVFNG